MDRFNNIDFEKGDIDENIRRARTLMDTGADIETTINTLITSGITPSNAFLAVQAAIVAGPML